MKFFLILFVFTFASFADVKDDIIKNITQLAADGYKVRKQAKKNLEKLLPEHNLAFLEIAKNQYLSSKDPELKLSLLDLMKKAVVASIKRPGFMGLTMNYSQEV